MSEICLDCRNKLYEHNDPARKHLLSWRRELCEDCGQMRRVIIRMRLSYIYPENAQEIIENIRYAVRTRNHNHA